MRGHGLANRLGQPSPTTFHSVDPPGIEPGFPPRQGGVFPLDHRPVLLSVDRMGVEPIAPILQGSVASTEHASPQFERSVRELNPVFLLTEEVCCRNTYRPPSDPGRTRTVVFLAVAQASLPLDHGIIQ